MQVTHVLFSDYYGVDKAALRAYGALDVSLLADLPLFVDPFLLFNSDAAAYQELHQGIVNYLTFLQQRSLSGRLTKEMVKYWYKFSEVKETWLGFSESGNRGSGLGDRFADALNKSFPLLFGSEADSVTKSSHLEKLCLVQEGVGRDNISDFTTNLIKEYLCNYTQQFAISHMNASYCKTFSVGRVRFNYKQGRWEPKRFFLPRFGSEYVLLVPRDILTRDETWINKANLIEDFESIHVAIPDDALRSLVNDYFLSNLPENPKKADKDKAAVRTIKEFPILVDYYIKNKEDSGDEAVADSTDKVEHTEDLFLSNFTQMVSKIAEVTDFYSYSGIERDEAVARIECLKDAIEWRGCYRFLYDKDGHPVRREQDVRILYRYIWLTPTLAEGASGAINDASTENRQKTYPVEFKLGSNTQLSRYLEKRADALVQNPLATLGIAVIFCFSGNERATVEAYVKTFTGGEKNIGDIIIVDADRTNKAEEKAMNGSFSNGYALVIGVAEYRQISSLPDGVVKDAVDVKDTLLSPQHCGYAPDNLRLLLNEHATLTGIREGLEWLAASAPADATAVVYFSGHGARLDGTGGVGNYLVPYDADLDHLEGTLFSGEELTSLLRQIHAQRLVVVFDSCHSGGTGETKKRLFARRDVQEGFSEEYLTKLSQGTGRVILASSRSDETSLILSGMTNSLFTHYLLEGLQGATRDRGDGLVRIFDLFEFVAGKVPTRTKTQHPIFKANDVEDNFPVALYRGGKKSLTNNNDQSLPPRPETAVNQVELRTAIVAAFNQPELELLCADVQQDLASDGINLDVDLETVGGDNKAAKVLNLITYMHRRGHLAYLVAAVRKARTGIV